MAYAKKLNKKPNGSVYVIEEVVKVTDGVYEGLLEHGNIKNNTIKVYTGPKLTGTEVVNVVTSIPSDTPWRTYIKLFSNVDVYITYETPGDTVEADDINLLLDEMVSLKKGTVEYDSFQEVKVSSEDLMIITNGFYKKGDGGGAKYIVSKDELPWSLPLGNNLYANIIETDHINYRMFGAKLNGIDSDYSYMKKAHDYGNNNKVLVRNQSGTIWKDNQDVINVKYDVDLRGSEALITNDNFYSWYEIRNDNEISYTYSNKVNKLELKKDTSHFTMTDNSLPPNTVILLKDGNKWSTRNDNGLFYDEYRSELMFHTLEGMCFGPLIHGYDGEDTDLTNFDYTRYNYSQIFFRGCLLRIETTPNVNVGFLVSTRHNVKISDFFIAPLRNSLANSSFKGSVITIRNSYNVELCNINGNNIAGKKTSSGVSSSGYIIRIMTSLKVLMTNCNLNGYWGAIASTCVKDWTIRDCSLNRVDVHNYFRDLTIDNCKIYDWGINLGYGTGLVTVKNCVFINYKEPDIGGRTLLNINNTYGYVFSGTLHLENIQMVKADFDTSLVKLVYVAGYNIPRAKLKLPNIIAKNIEIIENEPSSTKFYVYKIVGKTDFSTNEYKIEQANYCMLEHIRFYRLNGADGRINLIADSTDGNMYSSDVITEIRIKGVKFSDDSVIGGVIVEPTPDMVEINGKYQWNIYS